MAKRSCHYRIETKNRGDYYGGATRSQAKKRLEELRGQGIKGRIVTSCDRPGAKPYKKMHPALQCGIIIAVIGGVVYLVKR